MSIQPIKILVLTSLYPADDIPKSDTPVVHYFTKEWVKNGNSVRVIHFAYNLPQWAIWIIRTFPHFVSKVWGGVLRTKHLIDKRFIIDDVPVRRITLKKIKPHGRYRKKIIKSVYGACIDYLEQDKFKPDVIVSHWCNPQLEIMQMLKTHYNVPTVYVAHNKGGELIQAYGGYAHELLRSINLVGFRSRAIEEEFRERFNYNGPSFRCNSGIPEQFASQDIVVRNFSEINSFIYVGTFIPRKYPDVIMPAVLTALGNTRFTISFVGKGDKEDTLYHQIEQLGLKEQVMMYGYVDRLEVNRLLKQHDIFVMVSSGETFGLVYLEAMSTGCITIASRNEGMDGIIQHGINGFLCKAGDEAELTRLIQEIRKMPKEELQRISVNAIATARKLTDKNVAEDYLNCIRGLF